MKKLISFLGLLMLILTSTIFTSCGEPENPGVLIPIEDYVIPSGEILEDGTILIDGSGLETGANEFIYYDLKEYVGKKIEIDFSCKTDLDCRPITCATISPFLKNKIVKAIKVRHSQMSHLYGF